MVVNLEIDISLNIGALVIKYTSVVSSVRHYGNFLTVVSMLQAALTCSNLLPYKEGVTSRISCSNLLPYKRGMTSRISCSNLLPY